MIRFKRNRAVTFKRDMSKRFPVKYLGAARFSGMHTIYNKSPNKFMHTEFLPIPTVAFPQSKLSSN